MDFCLHSLDFFLNLSRKNEQKYRNLNTKKSNIKFLFPNYPCQREINICTCNIHTYTHKHNIIYVKNSSGILKETPKEEKTDRHTDRKLVGRCVQASM